MIIFDTNILIAHFGGESHVTEKIFEFRKHNVTLAISTVTECEVFSYPRLTPAESKQIEEFLRDTFLVFAFDSAIARRAATIRQAFPKLKLPDAAIAAIALEKRASLMTRNLRDFQKIPMLSILTF